MSYVKIGNPSGFDMFGGAPITIITDGHGTQFFGATGSFASMGFGYFIFKKSDKGFEHVHLGIVPTGRGILYTDPRTGEGFFSATHEEDRRQFVIYGRIPGFVPVPTGNREVTVQMLHTDVSSYVNRIDQLDSFVKDLRKRTSNIENFLAMFDKNIKNIENVVKGMINVNDVNNLIKMWWEREGQHISWQKSLDAVTAAITDAVNGKNNELKSMLQSLGYQIDTADILMVLSDALKTASEQIRKDTSQNNSKNEVKM